MADKKISALTAASTPLAGTEVLPIVQSGSTVKVAVSNLTEGRSVGAAKVNVNTSTEFGLVNVNSTGASDTLMTLGDFTTPGNSVGIYGRVNGSGVFSIKTAGVAIRLSSDASLANPVDILNGNVVIGTSGKGIDFSATSGTGTSELLDDYEEGTWTPTVTGDGGTNGTLAFTSSGTYTKTGRVVTLNGLVALTNLGSLTGRIGIGGVPFACDVETYFGSFGAANINPTGAATISSWSGAISTNRVHFAITLAAAGGMDSLRFTQLTTSTSLWFTISYITTA